jgi:hypothetical protein
MKRRNLLLLVLLAVMVPLTPMAYASPPDPVWVKGFYDDADFDDVVVLITSSGGAVDPFPLGNLQPFLVLVTSVGPADTRHVIARPSAPPEARAPPAS